MFRSKSQKAVDRCSEIAGTFSIDPVISRHAQEQEISLEEVARIATELKRFLALCAAFPDRPYGMRSDKVDALWHTFLLYNELYQEFCYALTDPSPRVLHHHPCNTDAGAQFMVTYDGTWADYRRYYNRSLPDDIWPRPVTYSMTWPEIRRRLKNGKEQGGEKGAPAHAAVAGGDLSVAPNRRNDGEPAGSGHQIGRRRLRCWQLWWGWRRRLWWRLRRKLTVGSFMSKGAQSVSFNKSESTEPIFLPLKRKTLIYEVPIDR